MYINAAYVGQNYNFQSTSIAYGVYECKWYDLPPKNAKDLMFIVYRSKIPLRLTAGKFGIFSMEMLGTVRYIRIVYIVYSEQYYCNCHVKSISVIVNLYMYTYAYVKN